MKRKITEISVFEFFICMFVIGIHLLSEGVDALPKWSVSSIIFVSLTKLMSFAVPGFIFTSAIKMFYKYSDSKFSYPRFLLGRLMRVYLPYALAVCLYYAVFVFALDLDGFESFDLRELGRFILNGNISAQFYFVILIMQFYILMPLWMLITKCKSKVFSGIILAAALIITVLSRIMFPQGAAASLEALGKLPLPFGNPVSNPGMLTLSQYTNKAFTSYLVFWIAGMYIGMNYDAFYESVRKAKSVIYIGWFVLAVTHCILSYMQIGGLIRYTCEPVIVVLFCLFSIFGFFIYADNLTVSLEKMGKGFLTSIAGASYDIYLIHCLVITVVFYYLGHIEIDNTLQRFFITTGITYAFSIIFCELVSTVKTNFKQGWRRRSAERSRKAARRKRYL